MRVSLAIALTVAVVFVAARPLDIHVKGSALREQTPLQRRDEGPPSGMQNNSDAHSSQPPPPNFQPGASSDHPPAKAPEPERGSGDNRVDPPQRMRDELPPQSQPQRSSGDDHSDNREQPRRGSDEDHSASREQPGRNFDGDHSDAREQPQRGSDNDHSDSREQPRRGSDDDHSGSHDQAGRNSGGDHTDAREQPRPQIQPQSQPKDERNDAHDGGNSNNNGRQEEPRPRGDNNGHPAHEHFEQVQHPGGNPANVDRLTHDIVNDERNGVHSNIVQRVSVSGNNVSGQVTDRVIQGGNGVFVNGRGNTVMPPSFVHQSGPNGPTRNSRQ
ncbi:hypothetical protein H4S07_002479 [Coemansia furcata]|uniref:Uncharacterized protein n=1 Tax=Coemansia furcata TaxID=417177 RepID=A0ACC1LKI1_9FUNG|nr:hypothetical protein H4S07_002479 [Coemansia furcata]